MFAQAPSAPRQAQDMTPAQRDQWKRWFLATADTAHVTVLDDTKARMQALLAQRRGSAGGSALAGGASPW